MKRLIEALKQLGITIPEDKQSEVKKVLSEQYKAVEEHNKTVLKVEQERDDWKQRAETAEGTLKGFEGVDLQTMQTELNNWKKKAEDAQKEYDSKIYERDFGDALNTELESVKFTSEAAKRDVVSQIKAAGLKMKDGKILGLSDLIGQIKTADASAFVDEKQEQLEKNKARFTNKMTGKDQASAMTKDEIMAMKDPVERRKAIRENSSLFIKEE